MKLNQIMEEKLDKQILKQERIVLMMKKGLHILKKI